MARRSDSSAPARDKSAPARKRKHKILSPRQPSRVQSIAEAVVIKDEEVFFLSQRDGRVPLTGRHGFGLYYHDCRYLNGYELRLAGKRPESLTATARHGFEAALELTNPELHVGGACVEKEQVSVRWHRVIDPEARALHDTLSFHNHDITPVAFPISLTFGAAFEDIFVVRGLVAAHLGHTEPPQWSDGVLSFLYDGSDKLYRALHVRLAPRPERTEGTTAHFRVNLPAQGTWELGVSLVISESPRRKEAAALPARLADPGTVKKQLSRSSDAWLGDRTRVQSDSTFLDAVIDRSLRDLRVLRTNLQGEEFYAAGVPWFVTLFGRDSLITALETLAYEPKIAEQTLRLLASYQGTKVDEWRDEQPGKIPHELRVGELARKGAIPHTPYYGTVDATPLFLLLLARHAAWTGDLSLFHDLRDNVERALDWVRRADNRDGDGYVVYRCTSKHGLANQGWKDSGDAIMNADGSLAKPPIALVEEQGYVYAAKRGLADLYQRAGDAGRAKSLRQEADALRQRFNRDFWLADKNFFALALQADDRPAAVVSSNPGQALWTGIVDEDKAGPVIDRLLADDLFTGWGVRTLSAGEKRYNPIGYHLGTVWPHDNALIAAGCRRYGRGDALQKVFAGITQAATYFPAYRLPEVFAGFRRDDFEVPVRYPVACHPQAWAAGAVPYLLTALLGLEPEAFDRRLRVVRPLVPESVSRIELTGLRVGGASVDLRFTRADHDRAKVEVVKTTGKLDVVVEGGGSA